MASNNIVFIAYQDQENLGIGYLTSMLQARGYNVDAYDFRLEKDEIASKIKKIDPLLVGFSLIFQYHVFILRDLAIFLRNKGLSCHFTVGGHYPSLRYEDILNTIPELDSVVRFEGEYTICELADHISTQTDWRKVKGIAYRIDGRPHSNELMPLIKDLDEIPFPSRRTDRDFQIMGVNYAHILASRGCIRNCSFCSIRKFYEIPPGKIRRSRSPKNVVDEMKYLYKNFGVRIFFFQDDDFFLPGRIGASWVTGFLEELEKEELSDSFLWKISCRSDEVNYDSFDKLSRSGLCIVYLGIESGNQKGLDTMNKQLSVEDNFKAVNLLKKLDINYEFGFMLFDPYSTFVSIEENLYFLEKICGDGSSPVVFCKMIPYAETQIEKELKNNGRLIGSIISPDYNFLDARIDSYWEFLQNIFNKWMYKPNGMLNNLRNHRFELQVLEKFYPNVNGLEDYQDFVRGITSRSNMLFLDVAKKSLRVFEKKSYKIALELEKLIMIKNKYLESINRDLLNGMMKFQKESLDQIQ